MLGSIGWLLLGRSQTQWPLPPRPPTRRATMPRAFARSRVRSDTPASRASGWTVGSFGVGGDQQDGPGRRLDREGAKRCEDAKTNGNRSFMFIRVQREQPGQCVDGRNCPTCFQQLRHPPSSRLRASSHLRGPNGPRERAAAATSVCAAAATSVGAIADTGEDWPSGRCNTLAHTRTKPRH